MLLLPIGIMLLKVFNLFDVPNSLACVVSLIVCMIFYFVIDSLYKDFSEKYLHELKASKNALSKTIEELSITNTSLQNEILLRNKAQKALTENNYKLKEVNQKLSLINQVMVDREFKMAKIKAELDKIKKAKKVNYRYFTGGIESLWFGVNDGARTRDLGFHRAAL